MRTWSRLLSILGIAVIAVSVLTACGTPSSKKGYSKGGSSSRASSKDLSKIPDAKPRTERASSNRPYTVDGKTYTPNTRVAPFRQRGTASWYGRRFHGRRTASGEKYDMYAMTAAHPTLPLPSYARVTSLENGSSVVVRINDRGPFVRGRIIDLSYVAARKLGYINKGSAKVEVEQIVPGSRTSDQETEPMRDEGFPPMAASGARAKGMDGTESAPEPYREISGQEVGAVQGLNAGAVQSGQQLFLQLGVFTSRENAESFRSYISAQIGDLSLKTKMLAEGNYFRICIGPYASSSEARTAAGWIEKQTGNQPFIIQRD